MRTWKAQSTRAKAKLHNEQLQQGGEHAHLWGACGNIRTREKQPYCADYEMQLQWMESQVLLASQAHVDPKVHALPKVHMCPYSLDFMKKRYENPSGG